MFYFLMLLSTLIVPVMAYSSPKLLEFVTKGEDFEKTLTYGKKRSWIYLISVIISMLLSAFDYLIEWLYSSTTISGLFIPFTSIYKDLYGVEASTKIFIVLFLELIFAIAYLLCRGLSARMVYCFVHDGACTKYKYLKNLMWILSAAFVFMFLFMFILAWENSVVYDITGYSSTQTYNTHFVTYNLTWIFLFGDIIRFFKSEKKALQKLPQSNYVEQPRISEPMQVQYNSDNISSDEKRLAELKNELQKIPVEKVKKWYAEGKLTEVQYKSIAKKYNTLKDEHNEIQERLALLEYIDALEENKKEDEA